MQGKCGLFGEPWLRNETSKMKISTDEISENGAHYLFLKNKYMHYSKLLILCR